MNPVDYYLKITHKREQLLEQVDEYSIYEYYIEDFELDKALRVPYREDNNPSFSVFESDGDGPLYKWYDHARGDHGDIVDLLFRLNPGKKLYEIIDMVKSDLGGKKPRPRKPKTPTKIEIIPMSYSQQDLAYWNLHGITIGTLIKYNVFSVARYFLNGAEKVPPGLMYAYQIDDLYKLYSPHPKFFINNYTRDMVEGLKQLPERGDILIIDKSLKDIMFCHEIGYPAVAGKSEGTLICSEIMLNLKSRFKRLVLMLDNDEAGKRCTEKYLEAYPFLEHKFLEGAKDKTDLCKLKGKTFVKQWMESNIKRGIR